MGSMFKRATFTVATRGGKEIEIPLEASQDVKAIELYRRASKETGLPMDKLIIIKRTQTGRERTVEHNEEIEPGAHYTAVNRFKAGGVPPPLKKRILNEIAYLKKAYELKIDFHPEMNWIMVWFDLPSKGLWRNRKGETIKEVPVLVDIPPDFPRVVPGVGYTHPRYAIHIPYITLNGRELKNVHSCSFYGCKKGIKGWFWMCFIEMNGVDSLVSLFRVIQASIYHRAGVLNLKGV